MQNIPKVRLSQARRLLDDFTSLGRRFSLRDPMAAMAEELKFTPPQLHAIFWLGQDQLLTMGELARRIGITEKTVTGVVDRLEAAGFAQRTRESTDRRVVKVRLTEQGQKAHETMTEQFLVRTSLFLSALDDEDRTALFRMLEKLVRLSESKGAE